MATRRLSVSVVIPCRNSEPFLRETIQSVLTQTLPVLEVIVVDDGSSDASVSIAEEFGSPVRVVSQRHAGVSAARNRGVRESRGGAIAFLDADDLWRQDKLERQVEYLLANPSVGAVVTSFARFREQPDRPLATLIASDDRLRHARPIEFLIEAWVNQSAVMVRADLARAAPYPENTGDSEDQIQSVELRLRTVIGALPDVMTFYRSHPQQVTMANEHTRLSLESRVRWASENAARLGFANSSGAAVPILRAHIDRIMPLYWRRDVKAYRRELAYVRSLWPADLDWPRTIVRPVFPKFVLRLKDWLTGYP